MKKTLLICLALSCFAFAANARVDFLPSSSKSSRKQVSFITPREKCIRDGYKYQRCDEGKVPMDPCSKTIKLYKYCCPEGYEYAKEDCIEAGLGYSSDRCGPYYKCK